MSVIVRSPTAVSGDALLGASALTTATCIPYVASAGLLAQDAGLKFINAGASNLVLIVDGASQAGPSLEVSSALATSPRGLMSSQYGNDTNGARLHLRKGRGVRSSPVVVTTGDNLGRLVGSGYDGAAYQEMVSIIFGSEGTIAAGRVPTNIQFHTATDAASSVLTERGRVNSAGTWGIGNGNIAAVGTLSILDRTASTGSTIVRVGSDGTNPSATTTQLLVRSGTTQGATNLQEWQNSAAQAAAWVSTSGQFFTSAGIFDANQNWGANTALMTMKAAFLLSWSSTTVYTGSNDTGLSRIGVSILGVGSGATGSVAGHLRATSVATVALTVATLPAAPVAGQRCFVSDSTVALTAGIGLVVVGGLTNGVPVHWDGAAWRIG